MKNPKWMYGVTTVPERIHDLLPTTLRSLAAAGFDSPRIFVDGAESDADYRKFGCPVTTHWPKVRTAGTWILAAWELFLRDASATHYAIFQDDITICKGVREYMEKQPYTEKQYWNLCTYKENEDLSDGREGWYRSNQLGRGAQALVFTRPALVTLLNQPKVTGRLQHIKNGWKSLDGTVMLAMKGAGVWEYVHAPSLVDHIGKVTTMDKKNNLAIIAGPTTFPGCGFDIMEHLPKEQDNGANQTHADGQ